MPATDEIVFIEPDVQSANNKEVSPQTSDDEAAVTNDASLTTMTPKRQASFQSAPMKNHHEDFLRKAVDVILNEAVFKATARTNKVLEWRQPEHLQRIFDFNLKENGISHDELLHVIKDTIQYSVKTGHPYFVNQLFSSLDPYGLIGQWLTDALNPSVYTYEVSPVFTLMEDVVLREMREIVGYENGKGDGIFCPGGSMANAYAISCARYKTNPSIKESGLHGGPRLVLFTSEDAHYSIKKMASLLGIGTSNVYMVKTDERAKMSVPHLVQEIKRAIDEGAKPFMVAATAGTTVLGAFDPLEDLADVCAEYGLWLHVDAAWGGGALMSAKHRHILKGIARADSVTWNPHKLLTAPQQCSTFLLKHEGLLSEVHSANASYLFQKDKFYDTSFDVGDKHVQCGRKADVFKFWFMWKAKGTAGFEQHVDKVFDNAQFFLKLIRERPGFRMVMDKPEFTNLCFWYVPPSLRDSVDSADYNTRLHRIAPKIKEKMMKKGSMMVSYQTIKNLPNFFRIVFQNSSLEYDDMVHLVEEFENLGCDL
ncbi:hypothetical protein RN001_014919 [Aquatica leii]|uniref:Cysteine sulfinic acid decarboxylase n=1 Tax=Aquatica leii TaxID=1421715 RepID=A0AAN7NV26_9COLE|nr:hypothetical protein RN001_014919 [Aquatica leii]